MTKRDDDEVFCARTGRRIGDDSNVIELRPWRAAKPVPVPDDLPSLVERMTIRSNLGGMTADEACDLAAEAELAALPARIAQITMQPDDDDI